jgi:tetratricopeptide (TPR) repeat protein
MYHYCGALVEINRYYKSSDKQDRKFLIQNSIGNLDYMISHAEQSSALMPEIYFTKGRILVLDGRNAEAVKEFLQAIRLKPDYADPYAAMADFYARIEKKQDALKILQEGLRQIPTSRKLARRYQELGGKLPRPEANPPLAETAKPETQPPVPVETAKKVLEAAPVAARQAPEPEPASPSERPPEKIGSPSNPWCRFCTDDKPVPAGK